MDHFKEYIKANNPAVLYIITVNLDKNKRTDNCRKEKGWEEFHILQ